MMNLILCPFCKKHRVKADRIFYKAKSQVIVFRCLNCGHIKSVIKSCNCKKCRERTDHILESLKGERR